MNIIIVAVVAALVFGAVIFIHELGHFATAKWSGIGVDEFAIGMGPTLFSFKKGETTYALRLLPTGGFVSMNGELEDSADPHSFQRASIGKRLLVMVSGAFMNLVLGFLALVVLISTGGDIASRTISRVYSESTGLQVGDEIIRVNGRRCFIINDMSYEFARTQNGTFRLVVRRDGQLVELNDITFDTVKATDEKTGEYIINEATGEPYEYMDVGFAVLPIERNVFTVTKQAFLNTLSFARLIFLSLLDLILGRVPVNQLSGPVGIVSEIGKAVSLGWQPVVQLLALISINLGVVNMLPFPALDGGRTLLLFLEAIRRKPLPPKYEVVLNVIGFALLMTLMIFVSFNDVRRLIL